MRHVIPDRWLARIRAYTATTSGEEREYLLAHDFRGSRSVHMSFPDQSFALFRYAFYLRDETLGEVAVFTEHCGYHFFPAVDLRIEVLESVADEAGEPP